MNTDGWVIMSIQSDYRWMVIETVANNMVTNIKNPRDLHLIAARQLASYQRNFGTGMKCLKRWQQCLM